MTKITIRDFLDEIVPALSAAGLSVTEIRGLSAETQRRMGEGGPTGDWIKTMGVVVAETGNERAMRVFLLALDQLAVNTASTDPETDPSEPSTDPDRA